MSLRLTDTHEEQVLWRGLQPAATASAGVDTARIPKKCAAIWGCSSGERSHLPIDASRQGAKPIHQGAGFLHPVDQIDARRAS